MTKGEMLRNLDLIEGWVYSLLDESTFSKAEQKRITKKVLAWGRPIRRLIEKVGEWQEMVKPRDSGNLSYRESVEQHNEMVHKLIAEIRDFGKEAADE